MKITRRALKDLIIKEMTRDQIPPHLRVDDDDYGATPNTDVMRIVKNMVEEIEGSHGGLAFDEAAEELVRRLSALGTPELSSMNEVAEALAQILLQQMTR